MMMTSVVGMVLMVLGVSILLKKHNWDKFLEKHNDEVSLLPLGCISLVFGSFVVMYYDFSMWSNSKELIVLVLGYLGLVKAFLLLFVPAHGLKLVNWLKRMPYYTYFEGVMAALLGCYMFFM